MRMQSMGAVLLFVAGAVSSVASADEPSLRPLLDASKRVVFLGDSITAAGQYVAFVDAWVTVANKGGGPRLICAGLPSETVSGLSEEGHAGGKFPRPDLAERLERILAVTKPDLVVACYGINCGIYEPFDEGRFAKYQAGMKSLKSHVEKAGAKFIVMTPPFYDDQRAPKAFSYNAVLDRYAAWLVDRRKDGWNVIDLHVPMTEAVAQRRKDDPKFTFQPDGVHPNEQGHWFVAQRVLAAFGETKATGWDSPKAMATALGAPPEILPLVQQRVNVLRDASVGTAGHKRPGVAQGLPLPEAEKKAAELTEQIARRLAPK